MHYIGILMYVYNDPTNMADMDFGKSKILYVLVACVMSYTIFMLSVHISHFKNIFTNTLCLLGRHTLLIYGTHSLVFLLLNKVCDKLTGTSYNLMFDNPISITVIFFVTTVLILIPICFIKEKLTGYLTNLFNK